MIEELGYGFQVKDNDLRIRERVRRRYRVGVVRVGPAGEAARVVLIPGCAVDQRNSWQVIHNDLLDAVERLLLRAGIGRGRVLRQQLVGGGIAPPLEVRGSSFADWGRVRAVQQRLV